MIHLFRDVRYALRQLRKTPGFTATAVLTLAFGIGATTAIFSIVEGVLLRPLPFADPAHLVVIGDLIEGVNMTSPSVPAAEAVRYMREAHSFTSLGAYRGDTYELSGLGEPAQINAARMNASVFQALGVAPQMGRAFTPAEDLGRAQVAVISYQTWRGRMQGSRTVIGSKILLDRKPYEIVGVMPRDFEFPLVPGQLNRSELWIPMSFTNGEIGQGSASWNFHMVGRLRPGVTSAQAQQEVQGIALDIMRGFPAALAGVRLTSAVQGLQEDTVRQARPMVRTLFFAVLVVLLIAVANLAGLLLVRVIRRRREIAVRLALGASGATVLRQSLIETVTLSVGGGLLGLGLASVAVQAGISFLPESLPRISSIGLNWPLIGFSLLLALATGLVCGLLPAVAAARTGVNDALKEGGRTGSAGGHGRIRSALVVFEIAVALVLLSSAGLLLRSFEKLRAVELGYRTDHVLTASYGLPHQEYSTQAAVDAFNSSLIARLRQMPGVEAVGLTSSLPGSAGDSNTGFYPEGYALPHGTALLEGWPAQVLGDFFQAEGIPLVRGRLFNDGDRAGSPMVVIVNRTLAERYWPGQDPVGKRIHIGVRDTPLPWMTVVGEIADIRQGTADQDIKPQFYQPASQWKRALGQFAEPDMLNGNYGSIVLRTALAPEAMTDALRSVVRSVDPELPLEQVESMERVVSEGQAPRRFNTALISIFAASAVLLAGLGIYSIIAFSAALRTQEMAIRMALGSQRSAVIRLVMGAGIRLGLLGCGMGLVGSFFAARLMRSMLFQVDPVDPLVLCVSAVSILLLALLASLMPARRVAAIDPMQALRDE